MLIFFFASIQNVVELCPVALYFEVIHAVIFFSSLIITEISILDSFILGTQIFTPKCLILP